MSRSSSMEKLSQDKKKEKGVGASSAADSEEEEENWRTVLEMNDRAMEALRAEKQKESHSILLEALRVSRSGLSSCQREDLVKKWLHVYALSLSNFGCQLYREGFPTDAKKVLEEAIKIERTVSGKASCSTMLNLSSVLLAENEPEEALVIAKECASVAQDVDPVLFITSLHNLAVILEQQKSEVERSAALPAMLRAFREAESFLGSDHPTTVMLKDKCKLSSSPPTSSSEDPLVGGLASKRPQASVPPPLLNISNPSSSRGGSESGKGNTYFSTPSSSRRTIESPTAMRNKAAAALRTLDFGRIPPGGNHGRDYLATYPAAQRSPSVPKRAPSVPESVLPPLPRPPSRSTYTAAAAAAARRSADFRSPSPLEFDPNRRPSPAGVETKHSAPPHRPSSLQLGSKQSVVSSLRSSFAPRSPSSDRSVFQGSVNRRRGGRTEEEEEEQYRALMKQKELHRKREKERQEKIDSLTQRSRNRAASRIQWAWHSWWTEKGKQRREARLKEEAERRLLSESRNAEKRGENMAVNPEAFIIWNENVKNCATKWLKRTVIRRYLARRGLPSKGKSEVELRRQLVSIQAVWRGALVRERIPFLLATETTNDANRREEEEKHYAALRIQTCYRAYSAKRLLEKIRERMLIEPTLRIQDWWRERSAHLKSEGKDKATLTTKNKHAAVIQRAWRHYKCRVAIYMYLLNLELRPGKNTSLPPSKGSILSGGTTPNASVLYPTPPEIVKTKQGFASVTPSFNSFVDASRSSDREWDSIMKRDWSHYTAVQRSRNIVTRQGGTTPGSGELVLSSSLSERMRHVD